MSVLDSTRLQHRAWRTSLVVDACSADTPARVVAVLRQPIIGGCSTTYNNVIWLRGKQEMILT